MEFWVGSATLDRVVCLAVHSLCEADLAAITEKARNLLVTTHWIDPQIQFLPDAKWIEPSLLRLIQGGFVKASDAPTTFVPAKKICEGWP